MCSCNPAWINRLPRSLLAAPGPCPRRGWVSSRSTRRPERARRDGRPAHEPSKWGYSPLSSTSLILTKRIGKIPSPLASRHTWECVQGIGWAEVGGENRDTKLTKADGRQIEAGKCRIAGLQDCWIAGPVEQRCKFFPTSGQFGESVCRDIPAIHAPHDVIEKKPLTASGLHARCIWRHGFWRPARHR
jgi:hypothetical protein